MKVFTKNEYDSLKCCLVAYPCNLQIIDKGNSPSDNINKAVAIKQYNNLINTLIRFGVKVQFLDLNYSPSQVFTKDIGFVIEDILFLCNMTDAIRKGEVNELISLFSNSNIKVYQMKSKVEGGDILVHRGKIFIGQGGRTNQDAVDEITSVLSNNNMNYEIIKVNFNVFKIHLDCVFNILDSDTCVLSEDVFNPEIITKHFSNIIKVNRNDADALAVNIVNLGNNNVLCCNQNLHNVLLTKGYNSMLIEFSEIAKAKGSIGCCILELYRG